MNKRKWIDPIMALITTRMLIVFVVLGLGAVAVDVDIIPFSAISLCFFLFSIAYLVSFKLKKSFEKQVTFQLIIDILLIFGVLKYSGGTDSFFISLILFPLISAGLLLPWGQAFGITIFASTGYLFLTGLDFYLFTTYPETADIRSTYGVEVLYLTFMRLLAMWAATFLSSYLSNKLKEQKSDLTRLRVLHNLILDQISSGIVTVNQHNEIVYVNKGAEELIGAQAEELKGKNWKNLFFFTNANFASAAGDTTTQEVRGYEVLLKRDDGVKLPIGFNVSRLVDHNNVYCGKVMIFRDLTRIKELERKQKQNERLAAVGEMAAGIAHEIRNPLASISGAVEVVVSKKAFNEKYASLMDVILLETQRLNDIIESFLSFTRRPELEKRYVDMEMVLEDVLVLLKYNGKWSKRHNITKVNHIKGRTRFWFDPNQLKQVFYNLIANACEAMPSGGDVHLVITETLQTPSSIKVEISDQGNGIDEERLSSIFTPFFTTKKMGTGLGLAIVHRIIQEHKGSIEVSSQIGKGTRFTMLLPRGEEAVEAA